MKEEPVFEVALDVEMSRLCFEKFLLDEGANFDLARIELERVLFDGRGGGIKALAEICLYLNRSSEEKHT